MCSVVCLIKVRLEQKGKEMGEGGMGDRRGERALRCVCVWVCCVVCVCVCVCVCVVCVCVCVCACQWPYVGV